MSQIALFFKLFSGKHAPELPNKAHGSTMCADLQCIGKQIIAPPPNFAEFGAPDTYGTRY